MRRRDEGLRARRLVRWLAADSGRADHRVHASAAAGRLAAALSRPGVQQRRGHEQHPVRDRPRRAGQPGGAAGSTSTPPAGDTQTSRPALVWVHGGGFSGGDKANPLPVDVANTFAKQGYVVVSINYRLLGSGCVGQPEPALVHDRGARGQARRPGRRALAARRRRLPRHRPDPDRHRRRVRRRHHRHAGRAALRGPRQQRQPGLPVDRARLRVDLGRAAERRLRQRRATRPACSSTAPPTTSCRSQWSDATTAGCSTRAWRAWLQHQDGAGHVPYAQYRTLYLEQTDYFLYLTLDLAHAAGQPTRPRARLRSGS